MTCATDSICINAVQNLYLEQAEVQNESQIGFNYKWSKRHSTEWRKNIATVLLWIEASFWWIKHDVSAKNLKSYTSGVQLT